MTQAQGPHEREFVVQAPVSEVVNRRADFDVYRPDDAEHPLPAVVFVPGPMPAEFPARPRQWPLFQGYGRLLAAGGVLGIVVDLPYHALSQWPTMAEELSRIIESVRALEEVDATRIAVWAFSGGAMLVGRWLADSPDWLRCVALTYPLLGTLDSGTPTDPAMPAEMVQPGRPLVLTRVGRERADIQATVDRFLTRAKATDTTVRVIEVPQGQHGFDVLDHTDQSQHAVLEATDLVIGHLLRPPAEQV